MPTRFHVNEIIDQLTSRIKTNLETPLGLKVIAKGGVEFYQAVDVDWSIQLPAVFVKPVPSTDMSFVTTGSQYEVVYHLRLVYIRAFTVGEVPYNEKVADTIKIAEMLIDEMLLDNLVLSNGQIVHSLPTRIEWEPIEDEFVATFNADFHATAIEYDVTVKTRRT